ncbi:MAG: thioredoxin-disulfide reductase [Lachnospiraceae bacterium]|nr:thioredoxin-disulfide reductase [Lachnospiraceae bacterium]
MYEIVIVGGGTAGLSAAIYGVRAGRKVLVLEQKNYGGQIINSPEVENYPGIPHVSGFEFATGLYKQATGLGAEFSLEKVIRVEDKKDKKIVVTDKQSYETLSVILATGAKNRPLGIKGEKELTGAGISYCATCDGAFFRDREVAVAGGGSTALEDAMFLAGYCKKVYVIHRREQFRGEAALVETLKTRDNVEFILNAVVTGLEGKKQLEGIRLQNVETGQEWEKKVDGLFVAIGQMPDNEVFSDLVEIDEKGYIRAAEDCRTGTPGVFTAGDCRTKTVRQLTTAAADGAVAGLAACEYISSSKISAAEE